MYIRIYVCELVCVRAVASPPINDRKSATVNDPQPAPQAQHSQDEGPDELAAGIRQRRLVPLRPRVVHKPLNVLQKRSEVLWFISFYLQIPRIWASHGSSQTTSAGNVMTEMCNPYWKDPPTPSTSVSRYSLQYCGNMAGSKCLHQCLFFLTYEHKLFTRI